MKTVFAKTQTVLLLVSGALLMLVGASIIVSPVDFYASNNIELGSNVSLLNELKAPAGLLLVAGLVMIIAIFVKSMSDTALRLAILIYLSYAATRSVSLIADGVPASGLLLAMGLEATLGLACLLVWLIGRTPKKG